MNRLLHLVDESSTWVGKTAGWCIPILTFTTSCEVFVRYLFLASGSLAAADQVRG